MVLTATGLRAARCAYGILPVSRYCRPGLRFPFLNGLCNQGGMVLFPAAFQPEQIRVYTIPTTT